MQGKSFLNVTTEARNPEIHDLQKFEIVTINRSEINFARYNPRTIGAENRKLLNRNLDKRGLMETLVWNKATGNLVSGHRRLEHLDEYHKKKYGDLNYNLTVAMVELSEKEEKEQNIFFNNPNSQGDWDRELMIDILSDIDVGEAGLTPADLSAIGIEIDLESHNNESVEAVINQFEKIKQEKKEAAALDRASNPDKKDWRSIKKEIDKDHELSNSSDEDYFVVTFSSPENKKHFMERFSLDPDNRYLKGEIFLKVIEDMIG